jgi:hypothetical protein
MLVISIVQFQSPVSPVVQPQPILDIRLYTYRVLIHILTIPLLIGTRGTRMEVRVTSLEQLSLAEFSGE